MVTTTYYKDALSNYSKTMDEIEPTILKCAYDLHQQDLTLYKKTLEQFQFISELKPTLDFIKNHVEYNNLVDPQKKITFQQTRLQNAMSQNTPDTKTISDAFDKLDAITNPLSLQVMINSCMHLTQMKKNNESLNSAAANLMYKEVINQIETKVNEIRLNNPPQYSEIINNTKKSLSQSLKVKCIKVIRAMSNEKDSDSVEKLEEDVKSMELKIKELKSKGELPDFQIHAPEIKAMLEKIGVDINLYTKDDIIG